MNSTNPKESKCEELTQTNELFSGSRKEKISNKAFFLNENLKINPNEFDNNNGFNKSMPIISTNFNIENDKNSTKDKNFIKLSHEESINISNSQCLICYSNQPNAVFMNCGHGGFIK